MKPRKSAKAKPAVSKAKKSKTTTKRAASSSDLPTGVLKVTVTQFRSLGALTPLEATLSDWTGFHTPPGVPMPQPPPTLTLTDNNVDICSQYPIQLIFNLPDPRYVLVGVAWEAVVRNAVGEKTFPDVLIQRDANTPSPYKPNVPGGSCLTVTDNAEDPGDYNYVLLIQDTETGEIGMFDPGIINKPPA